MTAGQDQRVLLELSRAVEAARLITRLRLKQAFGRLVRRADDRGVFVLLDRSMPSRLADAFPDGVAVERLGLADAVRLVGGFLAEEPDRGTAS